MRKILTIFMIFTFIKKSFADECSERENYLKPKFDKTISLENIISTTIADNESARVFFLGETHFKPEIIEFYPIILDQLLKKESEINCIFLESNPNYQHAIDSYMISGNYDDIEKYQSGSEKGFPWIDGHALNAAYKPTMEWARKKNIKVFAIDYQSIDDSFSRNSNMAKTINEKLDSICKKSVMPIGKSHLTERFNEETNLKVNNIPDVLKQIYSIDSASYNLYVEDRIVSLIKLDEGINWSSCNWNPSYPSKKTGIITMDSDSIKYSKIKYKFSDEIDPHWNQFRATIFL